MKLYVVIEEEYVGDDEYDINMVDFDDLELALDDYNEKKISTDKNVYLMKNLLQSEKIIGFEDVSLI